MNNYFILTIKTSPVCFILYLLSFFNYDIYCNPNPFFSASVHGIKKLKVKYKFNFVGISLNFKWINESYLSEIYIYLNTVKKLGLWETTFRSFVGTSSGAFIKK